MAKDGGIDVHRRRTPAPYRWYDAEDLVDAAEIAQRLGYSRRQVIHSWHRRYRDFPEPLRKLSVGYIWLWPEVERWAIRTGRLWPSTSR